MVPAQSLEASPRSDWRRGRGRDPTPGQDRSGRRAPCRVGEHAHGEEVREAVGDRLRGSGRVAVQQSDRDRGVAAGLLRVVDEGGRVGRRREGAKVVRRLVVDVRQPLLGGVGVGVVTGGVESEVAAVQAAGGRLVDCREQVVGECGGTGRGAGEDVQDVGGDCEADQPRDRGREQRERAVGRVGALSARAAGAGDRVRRRTRRRSRPTGSLGWSRPGRRTRWRSATSQNRTAPTPASCC